MSKTYLIVGGLGFIGSNSVDYFIEKGNKVIIYDNYSRVGAEKNLEWLKYRHETTERLKVYKGDIANNKDFSKLKSLVEQVDYVLHLAAQVAVTTSITDPRSDFLENALGTFNILEAVRLSKRQPSLIYSSTNKVYGGLEDIIVEESEKRYKFKDIQAINENQALDFHSPYGCSKGAADQYVRDYARIYGLKTVVCRQSCIYGPRQFGVEDQGWVAWFIIATILNKNITIYGNGKQVRDILFVSDLVELYDKIFSSMDDIKGKIFNVGGGPNNTLSLLELIDILEDKIGHTLNYKKDKTRHGDQPIYISDINLLDRTLGWRPKVEALRGIDLLWRWVNENKSLFK